jgi:3-isopropylmalate/(R)-2-methylmalate dehydratase small subunit
MGDIDPDFVRRLAPGDLIVAGKNFGCGSSREQAPLAIKAAGVGCVLAESFARIFYRNAINIGLPLLVAPEAAQAIAPGDELEVSLEQGLVRDITQGQQWRSEPFPEFIRELIAAGGLIEYTRERLRREGKLGR